MSQKLFLDIVFWVAQAMALTAGALALYKLFKLRIFDAVCLITVAWLCALLSKKALNDMIGGKARP